MCLVCLCGCVCLVCGVFVAVWMIVLSSASRLALDKGLFAECYIKNTWQTIDFYHVQLFFRVFV